ncbi:carboxypeptidase-like regulatory domain-containing protein [Mucilaginibacter lutimaris]|uniref:Carboxypeptidase-like regulatory domain-containing protein n=1 Tax=Mucilaginibacter lutimaris TaxID=931629 RepID=A0ABW2ZIV7_9SPHI
MKYLSLLLFFLIPIASVAQLKIEGKIVDADTGKPIPDASVFINNTTIGTKAESDGSFAIYRSATGQCELIVSVIGYQTHRQTIAVNGNLTVPAIKMLPKTTIMKEVQIGSDPKWKRKLKEFTEQFMGSFHLAVGECKILNPEVLELNYSSNEQILTAKSNGLIEIDNKILGYKVKYLLDDFVFDKKAGTVSYQGSVSFEEKISTSDLQKARWRKYRQNAYIRTPTYFLREVLADRADSNFLVLQHRNEANKLFYDTLRMAQYIHLTEKKGIYAMGSSADLTVFLVQHNPLHLSPLYTGKVSGMQVATIIFNDKYLYFDTNATILNRSAVTFGLMWGNIRVVELLPADYWPPERE